MKVRKTEIPADSLIARHLPADHADSFAVEAGTKIAASPDDLMVGFWSDMPAWVTVLFALRNMMVKLVGLKGSDSHNGEELEKCIREGGKYGFLETLAKDGRETVIVMRDKHLDAYISLYKANSDTIAATTLVRYNNRLGKVYFFAIRPFHNIIVRSMLKRAVKKQRITEIQN